MKQHGEVSVVSCTLTSVFFSQLGLGPRARLGFAADSYTHQQVSPGSKLHSALQNKHNNDNTNNNNSNDKLELAIAHAIAGNGLLNSQRLWAFHI